MNFQSLPFIEDQQTLLDSAFAKAKKRADQLLASKTRKTNDVLLQKKIAHEKITTVKNELSKHLQRIIDAYPDFNNLPEFYDQLLKTRIDADTTRISLGRVQGVAEQLGKLAGELQASIRRSHEAETARKTTESFYGRASSMLRQLKKPFAEIERARRFMTTFPDLKDGMLTVALAGFPNVGKSTLLAKMTASKPKIASYAFTTKTLNIGYYKQGYEDVQVVDTPGTLARFEKMNAIEQQAYLCLKYAAHVIVMVLDPTDDTYPLEEQERLLAQVKEHDKPVITYLSKTDIADRGIVETLKGKHGATTSPEELKEAIGNAFASL
ncbi:50S ribosome-binding GTPase [Candidatus Woesearchaeota archaeon]|nr:50S ribosome-binding GTPase [Candidatus Woesearchaeota archaeon]